MVDPAQPLQFSVASPSDIEQTARHLAMIREAFLAKGTTAAELPHALIRDSWQRCQALDVDATKDLAQFSALSDHQLDLLRAQNRLLLRAARPVFDRLCLTLSDVGYVVAVSDDQGSLLDVGGNRERRRRLARKGLLPGSNWSEAAAGTNAIGTALATGRVVQLLAAEHYCEGWQDVTCTAAPIYHPDTGAIVGVLDITGDYRLVRPFLTGLLAVAALEIQHTYQKVRPQTAQARPARFAGVMVPGSHSQSIASFASGPAPARPEPQLQDEYARRADAAERLAAAAGAMSASLDLTVTLDTVATQIGQVLNLPCAAVGLFGESGGTLVRAWQQRSLATALPARAIATLLNEPSIPSWCEYGAPTIFAAPDRMPREFAPIVVPAGIQALALLPLSTARGVLGVLGVARLSPQPWDVEELRLGLAVAAQAATALENARMFTALRSYARHTEALNALAGFLSALIDPSQHLDLVLKQIAEITDLDAGLMLLCEPPGSEPVLVACHGWPSDAAAGQRSAPLASLVALVEPVATTGKTLLICGQQYRSPGAAALAAAGFCDLVAVPLRLNMASIGVLAVGSRRHRVVTHEDLTLFTTIAQQIGLALSNARLRRASSETEALREADRLKSAFLATVSHDLRSPLTAIRASVEGLLERQDAFPSAESDGLLQNIARQASRLGRFVDQLLDLSCIEAGTLALDREWVEMPALLDDVLISFRQRYPDCQVERAVSPDLPLHYLDPASIAQVFWNLLENAQKYGPPEGPIRVEAFCTGAQVLINVADRGPGVALAERTRIFHHFYRLDCDRRSRVPGSGLGLAICRGVVEAHGGQIWVDERPGGGSVFRVTLPLATPDPAVLQGQDVALPAADLPRARM